MRVFHWPEEKPEVGRDLIVISPINHEMADITEARYRRFDFMLQPINAWDTGDYEFRNISSKEPCIWIYTDEFLRFLKENI